MDKEIDTNVDVVDSKKDVKDVKKKASKKKDDSVVKNVIDVNPTLNEAKGKTVVLGWGRMNPITSGHEKLANKIKEVAKKRSATPLIYLGHSQDPKKNPLSYDDKVKLAQMAFGRNLVVKSNAKTIFQVMKELESKFDNVVLVVGADRIQEFETLLNKYNGKDFTFDSIEVVSAGERTDPDSDAAKKMTADTMSASVMRKLASQGDFETFKKGLPKKLQSKAKAVFDMVRGGMKLAEIQEELDMLGEALTLQQRRKRALTMRRYKTKIAAARKRMSRRKASMDKLKQRSRKKAIQVIRKKVAGKQGANYKDLNPAQKMIIDKKVAKRKAVIDRIAKRMLPQVRKAEMLRLSGRKEEFDATNPAFRGHEVEQPKKKRYHEMRTKDGSMKIDRRFRAFKPKQNHFEEIETDVDLLNLIEEISVEIDEAKYFGHDPWHTKQLAAVTFKKGKYQKALTTLKDILARKKKENGGKLPHTPNYYASTVAKQYSGVDSRTLMNLLDEEGGAGDEGTSKVTKRYKKDTPGESVSEGKNMEKAKIQIKRLRQTTKERIDDIEDRARSADVAALNLKTEDANIAFENFLNEDKGTVKHHLGVGKKASSLKHMMKHATTHVDTDMDGDVDLDDFDKTVPDEITGAEKKDLTKQMYKKFKHEKQHTRKGVAFEQLFKEEVTQKQIQDLEKFADRLLQKFDIDVEFTRHFADRMNDERNKPAISIPELQRLFKKIHKEKGKNIRQNPDTEVVLKDIQSDLNLPVVINYDRNKDEFEVVNKTIMRKKDFKTSNKVVRYESTELDEAKGTGVKKFVRGMRVAKIHNPDMKGTVIKGGDNMKKSVEVEWDSGKTTLASGKYLMSISKNESVDLGEAKISVGDRVTLKPNKNTLDRSLIGKAGVVTGMLGSKPTVKFANGKTIAVSPKDLTVNESVELDELKVDIPKKKDSLGIPRHKMPQVAGKDYDELLSYLTKQGLKMKKKNVKASALKPTQSNFNQDKVVSNISKMKTMKDTKPIIVSSDNYIIDGHHRWLAVKNTGGSIDIIQADVPAKELIKHVSEFPKAFTRTIKETIKG